MANPEPNEQRNPWTDAEFYWDWAKHEDTLFTQRSNVFIVAESILFASLRIGAAPTSPLSAYVLYLLGTVVSIVWFLTTTSHRKSISMLLKTEIARVEPRWKKIKDERAKDGWRPVHPLIGTLLPLCFLLAWTILSLLALQGK